MGTKLRKEFALQIYRKHQAKGLCWCPWCQAARTKSPDERLKKNKPHDISYWLNHYTIEQLQKMGKWKPV